MDLIGIKYGEEKDTIFFSILGREGDCYGIAVYEGYKGLNSLLMLIMQQQLNLSEEYAMFNQRNLTCYWGNRDELTDKQRKTIKDLGYSYRGKNQWLYFLSFEPGYYPYNMDSEEVVRMSGYLQDLELALKLMVVDFVFQYGAPKEIRVSNVIVEARLEQICDVCGIKLRRVKRLRGLDSFMRGMNRFNM